MNYVLRTDEELISKRIDKEWGSIVCWPTMKSAMPRP